MALVKASNKQGKKKTKKHLLSALKLEPEQVNKEVIKKGARGKEAGKRGFGPPSWKGETRSKEKARPIRAANASVGKLCRESHATNEKHLRNLRRVHRKPVGK